jgi:two-component system, chemotaxis family, chemotaxis protein CheY
MKHILIVDDSATMRRMVMASLGGLGEVRFNEASTGLEAIERLGLIPIDLMILDMNMPDMHGLDVLKFVRGLPRYHDMPVIVLTTRGDEGTRRAAEDQGAALYLTKPFQPSVLVSHAQKLLSNH